MYLAAHLSVLSSPPPPATTPAAPPPRASTGYSTVIIPSRWVPERRHTYLNSNRYVPGLRVRVWAGQPRTVWKNCRIVRPRQRPSINCVPNCTKIRQLLLLLPSINFKLNRPPDTRKRWSFMKCEIHPFARSQGTPFYFTDIIKISVGGQDLPISQTVFDTAGSIIDSGTVITRLPPDAYSALSTAFQQQMKKYPRAPAYSIFDTCYDFGSYTTITIPTISFTFGGNVKVDLEATGTLIAVSSTQACLAFAGNRDDTEVGIFGNTQQKTLEVVYEVAGGKLGFGAGGCN
ncbi:UNVERIFIED_CONTAM: Aspartyl protease family protein [Sesamum angustifolium]|uniref:Aspartyl protease family protein n=1 Tax=Sesamum angustifolium TaxID=2727405 RepID=A0AAW2MH60_9LAMI